jgi:hypothetical protein
MTSFAVLASALAVTLMPTGIVVRLHALGFRPLQAQVPIGDPDDDDEGADDDEDEDEDDEDEEPWQVDRADNAVRTA